MNTHCRIARVKPKAGGNVALIAARELRPGEQVFNEALKTCRESEVLAVGYFVVKKDGRLRTMWQGGNAWNCVLGAEVLAHDVMMQARDGTT